MQKIVMTPQELVAKLEADIAVILRLRNDNHYRHGRPDEQNDQDDQDEYEQNRTDHDSAWESWADAMYKANNRMGSYLADAEKIIAALKKYVDEVEGEDEA